MPRIKALEERLVRALKDLPYVKAIVLFGSYVTSPELARDVDILLVFDETVNTKDFSASAFHEITTILYQTFPEVPVDIFDVIPFDPEVIDPYVLLDATRTGKLLYNEEESYENALEKLSNFMTLNEFILKRQRDELTEMLHD